MAFTSKVVILLVVTSLAWCQASAEGGSANSIVTGLSKLTKVTLGGLFSISQSNPAYYIETIDFITKEFVKANNNPKLVLGPLSEMDRVDVFQAYTKLSTALLDVLYAVIAKANYPHNKFIPFDRVQLKNGLESLRVVVDAYGRKVLELIPNSLTDSGINLFQEEEFFFQYAIEKY